MKRKAAAAGCVLRLAGRRKKGYTLNSCYHGSQLLVVEYQRSITYYLSCTIYTTRKDEALYEIRIIYIFAYRQEYVQCEEALAVLL